MSEFFLLFIGAAFANNLLFGHLVGLDLQAAASRRLDAAWLTGLATLYGLCLCLPAVYLLQLLLVPLELDDLALLFYILVIITLLLASARGLGAIFPHWARRVEALLPVILMNATLLAGVLLQQGQVRSLAGSFLSAAATGAGFLLLLLVLTCLRERIDEAEAPAPFRGLPVLLVTLGLLAMGLQGLTGL